MRRSLLFFALMSSASAAHAGDKPIYADAPAWVKPTPPIDPAKINADAPVLLLMDNQEKLEDGQVWTYMDTATRAASPQVLGEIGTIKLSWQPAHGDLIIHKAEIIRGDQHIDILKNGGSFSVIRREQGLEHWSLDGVLTATMPVPGLSVGDVLHVAYSETSKDPTLKGNMQAIAPIVFQPTRVQFARVRLIWPNKAPIQWRDYAVGLTPQSSTVGGMHELTFTLPAPKQPDVPKDAPMRYQHLPIVEASSFNSWADVSKVMAPLYVTDGLIKPGSPLDAEVKRIADAEKDPTKRAAMALQLVQDKVRYQLLGMDSGNYVPQPPQLTWDMRYGDCKAKTLLLLAMLHQLGIEAEPVLAHLSLGGVVAERLPAASAFNHVLVHATIGGQSLFLDGTASGARLADLHNVPALWSVLPVRAAGATLMTVTPTFPARPDLAAVIDLDESAGLNLPAPFHASITIRGGSAGALKMMTAQASKDDLTRLAESAVKPFIPAAAVVSRSVTFDDAAGTATMDVTGLFFEPWRNHGGRWELPLDPSLKQLTFTPDRGRPAWHDMAVSTGGPRFLQATTRIKLPANGQGFTLEGDQPIDANVFAFKVHRAVSRTGDTLLINTSMQSSGAEITSADIPQARQQLATITARALQVDAPVSYPPLWQDVADGKKAHRFDAILKAYDARIADKPDEASRYVARAMFQARILERKAALADLDKAIAIAPDAETYLKRSTIYKQLGDKPKAMADAAAAQQLDPASDPVLFQLAELKSDQGDRAGAVALLQDRIDAGGDDKFSLLAEKAELQAEGGDRLGAIAMLDAAIAESPGEPQLLNTRCWVKGTGNVMLDTALKDCTKSIELSDAPDAARDSRAVVYFRMNRYDDALADLDAVLTRVPDMAPSIFMRGIVRERSGDKKGAAADLAAARMLDPTVDEQYKKYGIVP